MSRDNDDEVIPARRRREAEALLDEMDRRSQEIGEGVKYGRSSQRLRYRQIIRLQLRQDDGSLSETEVFARNLSAGGLGCLHVGSLPRSTAVLVPLERPGGGADVLPATVVYSQRQKDDWWSVGLRFDRPVDPARYVSSGSN